MVTPYGFVLNDSLGLFNTPSRKAPNPGTNNAAPNKMPMGFQTPTIIVKDGEPFAATGTFGSQFIPSLVLNVVLDLIDHKQSLQDAVYAARIWGWIGIGPQSGLFAWNYASKVGAPTFDQFCPPPPDNRCSGVIEELRKISHMLSRRPGANEPAFGSLASVGVDPSTFALVSAADDVRQRDATAVVVARP
jgi:gamma-glutamyltranspeptidase